LSEFKVSEGQKVKKGEIIALSGNTGYSTSPHLHFSVKINGISVDPLRFIEIMEKEMIK
jgi:murein DD-endopeptidase MepM/ murein hydrolase activator NlpD